MPAPRLPAWLDVPRDGAWARAYLRYLAGIEEAFEAARRAHPNPNPCRAGCGTCCHGPFNISLADAALLVTGLDALPTPARAETAAAVGVWVEKARRVGGLDLFYPPEADLALDRLCESAALCALPCPCLDPATQACRVYAHRPLTCRMGGMLFVDEKTGEEAFDQCPIREDGLPTPPPGAPYDQEALFFIEAHRAVELVQETGMTEVNPDAYESTVPSVVAAWARTRGLLAEAPAPKPPRRKRTDAPAAG